MLFRSRIESVNYLFYVNTTQKGCCVILSYLIALNSPAYFFNQPNRSLFIFWSSLLHSIIFFLLEYFFPRDSTICVGHAGHMLFTALRFRLRLTRTIIPRPHHYSSLSTMGAIGTQTVDTTERLAALRNLMAERNIDAYVVPTEDQRRHSGLIRSR